MKFELQNGKYYRTRDGRKVGPLERNGNQFYDTSESLTGYGWYNDGKYFNGKLECQLDLVREWRDEKDIFTTVKKLNIGDFGNFKINENTYGVSVDLFPSSFWKCNSEELKQLANQLLEIVDHWENDGE